MVPDDAAPVPWQRACTPSLERTSFQLSMMPPAGLEPASLSAAELKSAVFTSFTMEA